jgi:hypothetical protein
MMVAPEIAVEVQPSWPNFKKWSHLRGKGEVLTEIWYIRHRSSRTVLNLVGLVSFNSRKISSCTGKPILFHTKASMAYSEQDVGRFVSIIKALIWRYIGILSLDHDSLAIVQRHGRFCVTVAVWMSGRWDAGWVHASRCSRVGRPGWAISVKLPGFVPVFPESVRSSVPLVLKFRFCCSGAGPHFWRGPPRWKSLRGSRWLTNFGCAVTIALL